MKILQENIKDDLIFIKTDDPIYTKVIYQGVYLNKYYFYIIDVNFNWFPVDIKRFKLEENDGYIQVLWKEEKPLNPSKCETEIINRILKIY